MALPRTSIEVDKEIMAREIVIGTGFPGEHIYFKLRAISNSEEIDFTSKYYTVGKELSEEDRVKAATEISIGGIIAWQNDVPQRKDGDETKPYYEGLSIEDATKKYFASLDPDDVERVANTVVIEYRRRLQPDLVF